MFGNVLQVCIVEFHFPRGFVKTFFFSRSIIPLLHCNNASRFSPMSGIHTHVYINYSPNMYLFVFCVQINIMRLQRETVGFLGIITDIANKLSEINLLFACFQVFLKSIMSIKTLRAINPV